jgi:integrase
VLRYYATRQSDGKRVERTVPIGQVRDLPSESRAWAEIEQQHLHQQINQPDFRPRLSFADLASHFIQNELNESADTIDPKAPSTIYIYQHILNDYLIPRWGQRVALGIEPLQIEQWLMELRRDKGLASPTLDKTRRVMSLVYKHAQRYNLIPRTQEANPLRFVRCKTTSEYEAIIITPEQAFATMMQMGEPERTFTLLTAATGLRISEALGLQWGDVDFGRKRIEVRRAWVHGRIWEPKSPASRAPVPMHTVLAEFMACWKRESAYGGPKDWVFPSIKLKGKQPRDGKQLVKDHLRPAAAKAGVLSSHNNEKGNIIEDDPRRFGFHNLRHSLASFLMRIGTDPKTIQALLRHADITTTLQLYTHSMSEDRLVAQGRVLEAILHGAGADS